MNFSEALELAKRGNKITRESWPAPSFVVVMPAMTLPAYNTQGTDRKVNDRTAKHIGPDAPLICMPYFANYTPESYWQPGWIPAQADLFAEDWQVCPDHVI